MRRFHSYGPVNSKHHFCVPRQELVEHCIASLVGDPEEGGHYFTIWAPRQTGKTWLMQQVIEEIPLHYPDQFTIHNFSLGGLRGLHWEPSGKSREITLPKAFRDLLERLLPGRPVINTWEEFSDLFSKDHGLWDRPLILLIDEVDTTPPALLDLLVGQFRDLYLSRKLNRLHGLALIGVRAVLGLDSQRGSPFNVQRSLHVPNFTLDEVKDLYRQYQEESGQPIDSAVVEAVYIATRGQPGLVSWFGELLTEKYNPGPEHRIDMKTWELVWHKARYKEPNNTVMNLIAKARNPDYQTFLLELFTRSDLPFSFHEPVQNYLYLNGILDSETVWKPTEELNEICRFTSPFVQHCLYDALSHETVRTDAPILPLDPLDDLADVFGGGSLNLSTLLRRYKDYLARLKAKGLNPWKDQPRRKIDFHLTEAVGHFHLYAWLKEAVTDECVVSPEFPTGNGKVDVHLRCGEKRGIIEVKSFRSASRLKRDKRDAAEYAKSLGLDSVTMAVFLPVEDQSVLEKISGEETMNGVQVIVVAIGWA